METTTQPILLKLSSVGTFRWKILQTRKNLEGGTQEFQIILRQAEEFKVGFRDKYAYLNDRSPDVVLYHTNLSNQGRVGMQIFIICLLR